VADADDVRRLALSLPAVEEIRGVVAWPWSPSDQWCKGFLAGIFDAERAKHWNSDDNDEKQQE